MLRIKQTAGSLEAVALEFTDGEQDRPSDGPAAVFLAQGRLPVLQAFFPLRLKLHLSHLLAIEDVASIGRYGIAEVGYAEEGGLTWTPLFYIVGGKSEEEAKPAGILRLPPRDHRAFIAQARLSDDLRVVIEAEPGISWALEAERAAPAETNLRRRIARILGTSAAAASPLAFANAAAAQCKSSPNYDSGSGYNGVDQSTIERREGNNLVGVVPDGKSGVTFSGLDFGHSTASDLQRIGTPADIIQQAAPFLAFGPGRPRIGADANAALFVNGVSGATVPAATFSVDQQQRMYQAVYPAYISAAASSFNQLAQKLNSPLTFTSLNSSWQTAFADMYFEAAGGYPTGSSAGKFINTQFAAQVATGDWANALKNLSNFGSPSKAQNDRATQNYKELIKQGCTTGTN